MPVDAFVGSAFHSLLERIRQQYQDVITLDLLKEGQVAINELRAIGGGAERASGAKN